MAGAQESSLGSGVITYSQADIGTAISTINAANEDYRAAYTSLKNYIENDLKQAIGGVFYASVYQAFDNNKNELEAVNTYVDELIAEIRKKDNTGATMAEDAARNIASRQVM